MVLLLLGLLAKLIKVQSPCGLSLILLQLLSQQLIYIKIQFQSDFIQVLDIFISIFDWVEFVSIYIKSIAMTGQYDKGIKIDDKESERITNEESELSISDLDIRIQHLKRQKLNKKKNAIFLVIACISVLIFSILVGIYSNYQQTTDENNALKDSQTTIKEVNNTTTIQQKKESEIEREVIQPEIVPPLEQIKQKVKDENKESEKQSEKSQKQPKPAQQEKIQIPKEQRKSIPGFGCKAQYFQNWNPSSASPQIYNDFRIEQVAYPQLKLVQRYSSTSPDNHFPEIVSYVNKRGISRSIFVHSGPIYPILVLAASVSEQIPIFVSANYKDKELLKTCFAYNQIQPKLMFIQEKDELAKLESSDLLVSSDSDFVKQNTRKRIMMVVEEPVVNPYRELTYKIEPSSFCYPPKMSWDWRKTLTKGIYIVSQQCKII